MSRLLVEDELWALVEPLLPVPKPRRFRYPGRKPMDHRAALTGILFVLKTGLPWNDLPREMGCGSGAACWVRLHERHKLGVWAKLHRVLLAKLRYAHKIDWSREYRLGNDGVQNPQLHRRRNRATGKISALLAYFRLPAFVGPPACQ